MSVLVAMGVLALLIFVHELGHFLAARLQGIYANRFSIGFGPALFSYQGSQTEYALRVIPLGGYVGFPDDDPDSEIDPADPNLLKNRPILDRAIVISAGVISNLVFAYLILAVQFGTIGVPNGYDLKPGVMVPEIIEASPAARAGLQAGDVIMRANSTSFGTEKGEVEKLVAEIKGSPKQSVDLLIQRGDRQLSFTITPDQSPEGNGQIGVKLAPNGTALFRRPNSPLEVFSLAAAEFQELVKRIFMGFGLLITRFGETASQVSGPVKIVQWGSSIAASDSGNLFFFAAFISINLAVINILPLPALDGGQLAFLLAEGVRGKPLPQRFQDTVMQTGLFMLLSLGVFLIIKDTIQLPVFQQLFVQ